MEIQWELPPAVADVLEKLHAGGYPAFVVGGCVRDSLLGKMPVDWDITTSATPEQMRRCFLGMRVLDTGLRHGTLTVLTGERAVEVTTYRVDGVYSDHRRPDSVRFTGSLEADLSRRDFTVNAMAYHPAVGLIDPFGGQHDLAAGRMRAVGNAEERFEEDALRILRAARFASALNFTVEEKTAHAMLKKTELLRYVSRERVFGELCKLLTGPGCGRVLRLHTGVITQIIPELAPAVGFSQRNRHHHLDVWQHTVEAVAQSVPELTVRFAMLLHDVGKPLCFTIDQHGVGHFYGHHRKSAEIAREVLKRLRAPSAFARRVERLVYCHDAALLPQPKHVRRWLARLGEEDFRLLLEVKRADARAKAGKYRQPRLQLAADIERLLNEILAENQCVNLSMLAVNGHDLLESGIPQGKAVGRVLDMLLARVIDGALQNEKGALLKAALEYKGNW